MNEIPISEFPSDVLNEAAIAVEAMPQRPPFKADVMEAIARAILAERERCAAVAIEYDGGGRKNNDVGWALSDVAAVIRQGQAKEGEGA